MEVMKILNAIKKTDCYHIFTEIILSLKRELVTPLTMLINKYFRKRYSPLGLKDSKVIPVFKRKGDQKFCDNCGLISILPVLSNIFETEIRNRMVK